MKKSGKSDVHVVKVDSRAWVLVIEHARTQREVIEAGRVLAKALKCELVIHRPSGQIRDSDSYGNEGKAKDTKH